MGRPKMGKHRLPKPPKKERQTCPECDGTGMAPPHGFPLKPDEDLVKCPTCHGRGYV